MNKKDLFIKYIKSIIKRKKLTLLVNNIFDKKIIDDNSYLFRLINNKNQVIIDIHDNVSTNRFNRYIFDFGNTNKEYETKVIDGVYITYIGINNIKTYHNNIQKFASLFNRHNKNILSEAKIFMDNELIDILIYNIKKTS